MNYPSYQQAIKISLFILFIAGCSSTPTPPITRPANYPEQSSDSSNSEFMGDYSSPTLNGTYADSATAQEFIQFMVQQHGFSQSYLNGLFSQARSLASVVRLETAEAPTRKASAHPSLGSWTRYRQKFLTESHITRGVQFWHDNAEALQKASAIYSVDPEYIVAIIGVETFFGRNVGKTGVFDALTTLAFDTQRRGKYFASELENFLLMSREERLDPRAIKGSWAGAMGLGQFMPTSFRKLAIDFNQDGKRNLWQSSDAIGSVANYFSHHGWQLNNPVAIPVDYATDVPVIELGASSGLELWAVYPNFKVIKKYNNSDKYAMAVHQLAQAIKQRYSF